MRAAARANGAGYQQYDFLIDAIIKQLWVIEFATTNCQSIMAGFTNSANAAAVQTGRTNGVKTPSGSETDNTTGTFACKYRGIENPWGNIWTNVDGIRFDVEKVYLCTDPLLYESESAIGAGYEYVGNRDTVEGYTRIISMFSKYPLLGYTTIASGGSANTYYCDYHHYNAGGQILFVGGWWLLGAHAGLWYWYGDYAVGNANASIGGRLCYKPL